MIKYTQHLILLFILSIQHSYAITIQFDYRYDTRGFFTDSNGQAITEKRAVLNKAASFYAPFLNELTAINPKAGDQWSVKIVHPSLAGAPLTLKNTVVAKDTITIYVGGSPSGSGVLGFAGTGYNLTATGSQTFVKAVTKRGQTKTFAPWGGYIWFNSNNPWHFGVNEKPSAGKNDMLTTAIHEIGHILGFGEAATWRQLIKNGRFTGAKSIATYGSAVPLDRYGVHWAEGVISSINGKTQETLMDPSTPTGQRQLLTQLDYAGFADMGWQIQQPTEIPLPPVAYLMYCLPLILLKKHFL